MKGRKRLYHKGIGLHVGIGTGKMKGFVVDHVDGFTWGNNDSEF